MLNWLLSTWCGAPGAACAPGSRHATQERKDTPTSPRPSPPLIHFPQAPGARSASLAFAPCGARGRRGRVPPARPASPLRPPGPLGPDGATAPRAYARSQASGASARRLRDKKKLGGGTGRGGFVVCAVLCDHVRNLVCVRDHALTPATPCAAPTTRPQTLSGAPATFQARATRACATQARATMSPRNPTYPT